jgi:predicted GIY-YIG superfamily endonuclease
MGQMLLIPDPRPLDRRLGRKFFRKAPKRPGVYLMRDAADNVLYVGKARNLQQRLRNYRIANPDRMPRRHLRMVREVRRIEFQLCPNESRALKHESKLLRSLKPKFNRAGVWPGRTRFIVWRLAEQQLELAVTDVPAPGWQRFGPLGGGVHQLHRALSRLLWLALNPDRAFADLPAGWAQGEFAKRVTIRGREPLEKVAAALDALFWESPDQFMRWLGSEFSARTHPFERAFIESELEILREFSVNQKQAVKFGKQLALF